MPLAPLEKLGPGEPLGPWLEKLRLLANLSSHLSGDEWIGIEEIYSGRSISLNFDRIESRFHVGRLFPFIVQSNTQDKVLADNVYRWKYTCNRAIKTSFGNGDDNVNELQDLWEVDAKDTTDKAIQREYSLYSNIEAGNKTTNQTYGNGVTQDDLTAAGGTWALKPIPSGTAVYATPQRIIVGTPPDQKPGLEWTIVNLPNGVTGRC